MRAAPFVPPRPPPRAAPSPLSPAWSDRPPNPTSNSPGSNYRAPRPRRRDPTRSPAPAPRLRWRRDHRSRRPVLLPPPPSAPESSRNDARPRPEPPRRRPRIPRRAGPVRWPCPRLPGPTNYRTRLRIPRTSNSPELELPGPSDSSPQPDAAPNIRRRGCGGDWITPRVADTFLSSGFRSRFAAERRPDSLPETPNLSARAVPGRRSPPALEWPPTTARRESR